MTTDADQFYRSYAAALQAYLAAQDEASLSVGHELGRRALRDQLSILDIIEHHFTLLGDHPAGRAGSAGEGGAALQFLLQTLTALDFASRGFVDGTRRYERERDRADNLADRDKFRTALVNALQEGFFVAGEGGEVTEINDAFAALTGYPASGLPYRWPHPWLVDRNSAAALRPRLEAQQRIQYETPLRHRDGHLVWTAVSVNKVPDADREVYVGTLRDVTAQRAFAARETAVLRLATAVSVAKTVTELLAVTLDICRLTVDVRRVMAVIWPPGGDEPTVRIAGEGADETWDDLDPALRRTLQDARAQLPLTVQPVPAAELDTAEVGKSSGIVAMLSGGGEVALWLELAAPRNVSAEDRLLATALAGHLSLAVQHVRQFEAARDTSLTLQRAILAPSEPPPGFAVRYEPAVSPLEIGGDWYDVLPIGGHRIAVIVGDCVGRGLAAAAVMGQLRSSARALLLTGAEPARVLEHLDSVAALIPDAVCTTAFVAIVETRTATLHYSCAGHLPAVMAGPGAPVAVLADARSVPLAVRRTRPRPQASLRLTPAATLVFYTDGLVERRGEPLDNGIARLGELVAAMPAVTVDAVADAAVAAMAPAAGYEDDVALVVYRHPPDPLRIDIDASAECLHQVRRELTDWLGTANVAESLRADIVVAVNEACENSIEHGYRGRGHGRLQVGAGIAAGAVTIRVSDAGSWRPPPADPGARGRGLLVIGKLADRFTVEHTDSGTSAEMVFGSAPDLHRELPATAR